MITFTDKKSCSGCYACLNICPKHCISMHLDNEGFEYPEIDKNLCIDCNLCNKVCQIYQDDIEPTVKAAYGVMSKSYETRQKSSSGGFFSILAEYVLEKNGAVYGAAFVAHGNLEHIRITDIDNLDSLRRSKYIQSKVGNIYNLVKEDLKNGLWVLFTGTPCQVGGLYNFLNGENYENLICHDFICHGVPPQKIFHKYLKENGFDKEKAMEISFRHKSEKKDSFSLRIQQEDHISNIHSRKTPFMRAFISDIMLRPSCYDCKYKNLSYRSDITLGDFWKIENVLPDFSDGYGVSLIFLNTVKGEQIFNLFKQDILYEQVPIDEAIKGNKTAIVGANYHPKREIFFSDIDDKSFKWLVNNYVKGNLFVRGVKYLKRKLNIKY